jgi:hypothetical protein
MHANAITESSHFTDHSYDRLGIGPRCCIDEAGYVVCSAVNNRPLELITQN